MSQFDIYDRIGRDLKMSPGNVIGLRNVFDMAAGFAGVFTAGVGVFDSAKSLLKAFGVIEDEMGQIKLQLAEMDKNIKILMKRIGEESEEAKINRRLGWKRTVEDCASAGAALRISRSPDHHDRAKASIERLVKSLGEMLAWGEIDTFGPRTTVAGHIPFVLEAHKAQRDWRPGWALPEHWFQYAAYMRTLSGYPAPTEELQRIWDPGHFVDLIAAGFRELLACLAIIEPAYRSTPVEAHRKLRQLTRDLGVFIDTWERMLLVTPVELQIRDDGYLQHPYLTWYPEEVGEHIALGVADLATGATTLDVRYRVPNLITPGASPFGAPRLEPFGPPGSRVQDVEAGRAAAQFDLQRMVNEMKSRVGMRNLKNLYNELGELVESPTRSQICRLRDFTSVSLWGWEWPVAEEIEIHNAPIANAAGRRKYKATRWSQLFHKQFRIPIVRRMDMTLCQLGYRIRLNIAREVSEPAKLDLVICKFNTWNLSHIRPTIDDFFPVKHFDQIFSVPDAAMFEVVQTGSYTSADATELDKQKPGLEIGRIFVPKKSGPVSVHVKVDTEIDFEAPDHAFVGFADVLVELHKPGDHKNSFIVDVAVYETGLSATDDEQIEQFADGVTLHMIPTFLIAEDAYFIDYMKGLAEVRNTLKDVPPLVQLPLPLPRPDDDPFSPIQAAKHRDAIVNAVEALRKTHPEVLAPILLRRLTPPRVRRPLWSHDEAREYALRALATETAQTYDSD